MKSGDSFGVECMWSWGQCCVVMGMVWVMAGCALTAVASINCFCKWLAVAQGFGPDPEGCQLFFDSVSFKPSGNTPCKVFETF